jgi:hypothetical protein
VVCEFCPHPRKPGCRGEQANARLAVVVRLRAEDMTLQPIADAWVFLILKAAF